MASLLRNAFKYHSKIINSFQRDLPKYILCHQHSTLPSNLKYLDILKSNTFHQNSLIVNSFNTQTRLFRTSFRVCQNEEQSYRDKKLRSTFYYLAAVGILVVGLSYAAVPLYRIFCQAYSYGGEVKQVEAAEKIGEMEPLRERKININFNADIAAAMQWNFRPQQKNIELVPGETALAFYTAKNPTDKPVIGVSTYNVLPFEAGQYFNKIQCFCFEEQMLNPNEEVSMPVFFYIDPEFADDPSMDDVDNIVLSYTFFESKPGMEIPLPGFMRR